jgi:hypothetical protein
MFYVYFYVYIIFLVFVLGLYFTDERKHVAFGFLNLAGFTEDDVLQFHSFPQAPF